MMVLFAPLRYGAQSFKIRLLVPDDADHVDAAKFLLASLERRGRDLNGVVIRLPAAGQRFQNPARLFSAAAAEFGDVERPWQHGHDLVRVAFEEPGIGPGQAVLRQHRYRLEKRRAYFVVEIL